MNEQQRKSLYQVAVNLERIAENLKPDTDEAKDLIDRLDLLRDSALIMVDVPVGTYPLPEDMPERTGR